MNQSPPASTVPQATLFGQPAGLYTLFFVEMWERFSFYGLRALLTLYLLKGFLQCDDSDAYTIYGAYLALVNMTPFFGGMLADRLVGARRAVVFGGLLMAAGQACLMVANAYTLFLGLALLIVGNGYFKPNISKIVGTLYANCPGKRDSGFTIFYMGINLGAAAAPLVCGYVGEKISWSWGFGLAGVGMLVGLGVLMLRSWMAQAVIAAAVGATVTGLIAFGRTDPISIAINVFIIGVLLASAGIAIVAIGRGGLPAGAGAAIEPERLKRRVAGLPITWVVYLATLVSAPVFMLLVCGGAPLKDDGHPHVFVQAETLKQLADSDSVSSRITAVALKQVSTPAGVFLAVSAFLAGGYLLFETFRLDTIARHRMCVVLILVCVSLVFWAFFEQAGSSMNTFTDRNVDRVADRGTLRTVTAEDVGETIQLLPTQEQVGYHNGDQLFTLDVLNKLLKDRKAKLAEADEADPETKQEATFEIAWKVAPDNAPAEGRTGMKIAAGNCEIATTEFQSANPMFILLLGLPFTALWSWLNARKMEPSTPAKFAAAFIPLALGFGALWYGAQTSDARGMVAVGWLLLAYLLHTIGELCLSPVGLSMMVKLSPARLASTVIGGWFLATAVGRFFSGILAQFTNVGGGGAVPPPTETVHVYGNVFGLIALASLIMAAFCFCLVPLLKRWMHEGEE